MKNQATQESAPLPNVQLSPLSLSVAEGRGEEASVAASLALHSGAETSLGLEDFVTSRNKSSSRTFFNLCCSSHPLVLNNNLQIKSVNQVHMQSTCKPKYG